jgi:hypothetical protein
VANPSAAAKPAPATKPQISKVEEAQMSENKNLTPEELKDINSAFDLFRKKDEKNPADDGVLKVNDLGLAMRNVRFTPGPVELQEIQKEVDLRTDKLLREAKKKAAETGKEIQAVPIGLDRKWFTKIISAKMNEF